MTNDELTEQIASLERVTRQAFAVLTELHAETERGLQRMENGISHLVSVTASHEGRIRKLEG